MGASSSRIAVFGAGYVGLVTGACFAELGHPVVVRDVLADRIEALRRGTVPIYEPGLDELIARNTERLSFTTDVAEAIDGATFVYVAVGTPPTYSGDADLSAVWTVIDELPAMERRCIVVMKSTVPVGTGAKVRHRLDARGLRDVGYVSNPEFTAEGTAVRDFLKPDRIVVGSFRPEDGEAVVALHDGIDGPVVRCDVASAEMIKLAANAALMTRISFINEIANVCEATGADVVRVAEGIGLDRRIGPSFLRAGIGFGGSCLDGGETVLARAGERTWLTTLERLHADLDEGFGRDLLSVTGIEVLSWIPGDTEPCFRPLTHVTRRRYDGDVVEIVTEMGRKLTCTVDHPLVLTGDARHEPTVKLAGELAKDDRLPIAQAPSTLEADTARLFDAASALRASVVPVTRARAEQSSPRVQMAHALQAAIDDASPDDPQATYWRFLGSFALEAEFVPHVLWSASQQHKLSFLVGLWRAGRARGRAGAALVEGFSVRSTFADAVLRLIGDLGLEGQAVADREMTTIAIRPGRGGRRTDGALWVRVVGAERRRFDGYVYSLEVPDAHTFVTTGGLVVHNCFPKDSLALKQLAANSGYHFQLLNAVIEVNELQKRRVIGKLHSHLGSLRGKTVALLGLAFKPNTDDMREAPSLVLAGRLLAEGAEVRAWDPIADGADLHGVEIAETPEAAAEGADAVVVVTEWPQLADVDWAAVAKTMRTPVLIDGRNMLDPSQLREAGFTVEGMGRAAEIA